MGSSKKATVGYWYKLLLHFGWCQGPIDAFLQFRGGDRPAWQGELTESGQIYVDAPELWGGTESEGGIQGYCDVMFGEPDQAPNAYLTANLGADQTAYRGRSGIVFKGGKYGAFNPYPKPASFKIRRILQGWDDDAPWYPEKAVIGLTGGTDTLVRGIVNTGMDLVIPTQDTGTWSGAAEAAPPGLWIMAGPDRYVLWGFSAAHYSLTGGAPWVESIGSLGGSGGERQGVYAAGLYVICGGLNGLYVSSDQAISFSHLASPEYPQLGYIAAGNDLWLGMSYYVPEFQKASSPYGPWTSAGTPDVAMAVGAALHFHGGIFRLGGAESGAPKIISTNEGDAITVDGLPAFAAATTISCLAAGQVGSDPRWVAGTDSGEILYHDGGGWILSPDTLGTYCRAARFIDGHFVMCGDGIIATSVDGETWVIARSDANQYASIAGLVLGALVPGLKAMNPAHMIYDGLVSQNMQSEPAALIDVGSFEAAADQLFDEGFGLCTTYDPDSESIEGFRQRICNVIGASCSRSRTDGKWRLHLIRGDYDLESLPILSDDDILEYQEEPSTLDDAVNQVVIEWFDPEAKEERSTAPLHALGAIQAAGGVISETIAYREIPLESLAQRVGARDLRSKATPLKRMTLTTNRVPYAWLIGEFFRLQAPKRGIGDMVCMVGDIDVGTLRSGAIRLVAVQDVFAMPDTVYIIGEPGGDPNTPTDPVAATLQLAFEAPYVELAGTLPNAELAAVPVDAGYLQVTAVRPLTGLNYSLFTAPTGEEFSDAGLGDWCPSALVVESAGLLNTTFTLTGASDLTVVDLGTAALWDGEIVRVDALAAIAGTVTLGRGCGDTVPIAHAAGSRLYFYDAWSASDFREYSAGEVVSAKVLTRTGSARLPIDWAPPMSVEMDQRATRPYPPGQVAINGEAIPTALFGTLSASWAHRDRLLQADQLVETSEAGIGPEPGTTYTVRWYLDDDLEQTDAAIAGTTSPDYTPSGDGVVRVEIQSVRDAIESWQQHVRTFLYTAAEVDFRITESGDVRVTESADHRITE